MNNQSTRAYFVVVAWHCPIQSFLQLLNRKVFRLMEKEEVRGSLLQGFPHLTRHIPIARHVSIPIVSNVGSDLLVQRREGRDVGVRFVVNKGHLHTSLDIIFIS